MLSRARRFCLRCAKGFFIVAVRNQVQSPAWEQRISVSVTAERSWRNEDGCRAGARDVPFDPLVNGVEEQVLRELVVNHRVTELCDPWNPRETMKS